MGIYSPQAKFVNVMFSQVSVSPHWGVCLPLVPGRHPPGRHPPGQTSPLGRPTMGRHPPAQCMLGYTPPRPVHAGIRSTSGQYASHWNAFLSTYFLASLRGKSARNLTELVDDNTICVQVSVQGLQSNLCNTDV